MSNIQTQKSWYGRATLIALALVPVAPAITALLRPPRVCTAGRCEPETAIAEFMIFTSSGILVGLVIAAIVLARRYFRLRKVARFGMQSWRYRPLRRRSEKIADFKATADALDDAELMGAANHPDHSAGGKAACTHALAERGASAEAVAKWMPPARALHLPTYLDAGGSATEAGSRETVFRAFSVVVRVTAAVALASLLVLLVGLVIFIIGDMGPRSPGSSSRSSSLMLATPVGLVSLAVFFLGLLIGSIWLRKRTLRILLLRPFGDRKMSAALKKVVLGRLGAKAHVYTLSDRAFMPNPFLKVFNILGDTVRYLVAAFARPSMRIASVHNEMTYFKLACDVSRKMKPSFRSLISGGQAVNIRTSDAWWKQCIDMLMHSTDYIVMDISLVKPGSAWEIEQLHRRGLLDRCVFIVQERYKEQGLASIAPLLPAGFVPQLHVFRETGEFLEEAAFEQALRNQLVPRGPRPAERVWLRQSVGGSAIAAGLALMGFGATFLAPRQMLDGFSVASLSPAALRAGPKTFRDCPNCPEMVIVPAGSFVMGASDRELASERSDMFTRPTSEQPRRNVTIGNAFAIGRFEVTFDEWATCVADGGCSSNTSPADGGWGKGRRPVISVSWNDAKEFARWISQKTGKSYRLLSEAEWEYAARAGTSTIYSWGDDQGENRANCSNCRSNWKEQSAPVGSFSANGFGLFDMHGNVNEWVEDCWHDDYRGAPIDGSAWTTSCPNTRRVVRSGSWLWNQARSAYRHAFDQADRGTLVGFRLSRALEAGESAGAITARAAEAAVSREQSRQEPVQRRADERSAENQAQKRRDDEETIKQWSSRYGRTFRDCANVCPEMVVVPHGGFMMGSPDSETGFEVSFQEKPYHQVTIARPFAVGKFEVTFAEWDACVTERGCRQRPNDRGWGRGKRPVIHVSWDEITKEYLPWLSRKSGAQYRLLTEAEWEYAARAGTTSVFSTGRMLTASQANVDSNSSFNGSPRTASRKRTVEVGTFRPNAFGLYDMHGNVWEWVADCQNSPKFDDSTYAGAPVDGSERPAVECDERGMRGGSWNFAPHNARSAQRGSGKPESREDNLGFRVARSLDRRPADR